MVWGGAVDETTALNLSVISVNLNSVGSGASWMIFGAGDQTRAVLWEFELAGMCG